MGKIGNFGKLIVFETSDQKILTFNDFQKTVKGSWANHERFGKKSQSEFLGPDLATVTFKIVLSAAHGIRPRTTIEAIENAVETGQVEYLVIGSKNVGSGKWKITQVSESWSTIYTGGELARAELDLTLEEYL